MASVYLDYEFFGDKRFGLAAEMLGEHPSITKIRVIDCWAECYHNLTPSLSARQIRIAANWSGDFGTLIAAFIDVGITDDEDEGTYEFRGTAVRIEIMLAHIEKSRSGGLASGKARRANAKRDAKKSKSKKKKTRGKARLKSGSTYGKPQLKRGSTSGEPVVHLGLSAAQPGVNLDRTQNSLGEASVGSVGRSIGQHIPLSPPAEARPPPDPPRPASKRDARSALEDEAVRILQAVLSIAHSPPSGATREAVHAEIERRVPELGRRVVELRFGRDGWRSFVETIQAAAQGRALAATEDQLRKAILAELRRPAQAPATAPPVESEPFSQSEMAEGGRDEI